jgi:uncharacterized BrkB/YihY/UPF0761 family membrane protein
MGLLAYFDLKDCGYITNIIIFITSYILIVWVYYNRPSTTTETEDGLLVGLMVLMPIIYLSMAFVIRQGGAELKDFDDESGNSS